MSMTGPAAVLLLRAHTGSSAPGAILTAAGGLSGAAGGPLWGRLVDRKGAGLPLILTGLLQGLCLMGIVITARHGAVALPVALGIIGGAATPPVTPTLRRWLGTLPVEMHATAMGMEAVSIEAVFLIGPSLVGLTVAVAGPSVALLVAAGAVAVGGVAVAVLGRTPVTPPRSRGTPHAADTGSLLRLRALRAVIGAEFLQVAAFAVTEVAIVTAAARDGRAALGGIILAVWACSSGIGGLLTTSLWRRPTAGQRFVIASACMAAGLLLLSASSNPLLLLGLVIPAGLAIAPANAAGAAILASAVPAERQAEAFAWGSAMAAPGGAAIGYAAGGGLVQAAPLAVSTLTAGALASIAAVIAVGYRRSYPQPGAGGSTP
jgi:MFS family permease